jgi:hypothetical protein
MPKWLQGVCRDDVIEFAHSSKSFRPRFATTRRKCDDGGAVEEGDH